MICKDRDIIHRCLLSTTFDGLAFFGSYIALSLDSTYLLVSPPPSPNSNSINSYLTKKTMASIVDKSSNLSLYSVCTMYDMQRHPPFQPEIFTWQWERETLKTDKADAQIPVVWLISLFPALYVGQLASNKFDNSQPRSSVGKLVNDQSIDSRVRSSFHSFPSYR